jgi:hypothetical protein
MRVRHIHITGEPRYIGKEVSEVIEEIAENTNGELLNNPAIGLSLGLDGVGSQEYKPDNNKSASERLQYYYLATIHLLTGLSYRNLQRIKNGRVAPHIRSETLIKRAMDVYNLPAIKTWLSLSDNRLVQVTGCKIERAKAVHSGATPVTTTERKRILRNLSIKGVDL